MVHDGYYIKDSLHGGGAYNSVSLKQENWQIWAHTGQLTDLATPYLKMKNVKGVGDIAQCTGSRFNRKEKKATFWGGMLYYITFGGHLIGSKKVAS